MNLKFLAAKYNFNHVEVLDEAQRWQINYLNDCQRLPQSYVFVGHRTKALRNKV